MVGSIKRSTVLMIEGSKMRIPGLGQVTKQVVLRPLPGSQIYENLVSGSIDACEWVGLIMTTS